MFRFVKLFLQGMISAYRFKDIAEAFLKDENVQEVSMLVAIDYIRVNILLKDDDVEDLDLTMATIQNNLGWKYRKILPIEIDYCTNDYYSRELDSVVFSRGVTCMS